MIDNIFTNIRSICKNGHKLNLPSYIFEQTQYIEQLIKLNMIHVKIHLMKLDFFIVLYVTKISVLIVRIITLISI